MYGCGSKETKIYDVAKAINNPVTFDFNKYVSNIKYIPLETKSECMVGDIKKVLKSENLIFLADFLDNLFVFDLNGKFIRKIGNKGKGPNEYITIADFTINNVNKEIVISSLNELLIFNFNGKFKYKTRINDSSLQVCSIDDRDRVYYIKPNIRLSNSFADLIYVYTTKGELLKTIKASVLRKKGDIPFFNSIYTKNNNTYYKEEFSNTLYRLNSKLERKVLLEFDFGKYAFKQIDFSFVKFQVWPKKYRFKQLMDFENIEVVRIQNGLVGNKIMSLMLDKKTGELINPNISLDRKFDGFILDGISHQPICDFNNQLITIVSPDEIIEHIGEMSEDLIKISSFLKMDSNPVVAIMNIK